MHPNLGPSDETQAIVSLLFLAVYFWLLLNENKKVDLSFFPGPDLFQGNSVYPPNLYPFVV